MERLTIKRKNDEYVVADKEISKENLINKLGQYEDSNLDPGIVKKLSTFSTLSKALGLANEKAILEIIKLGLKKRACLNCAHWYNDGDCCTNVYVIRDIDSDKGCWHFKKKQIEDFF